MTNPATLLPPPLPTLPCPAGPVSYETGAPTERPPYIDDVLNALEGFATAWVVAHGCCLGRERLCLRCRAARQARAEHEARGGKRQTTTTTTTTAAHDAAKEPR